MRVLVVSAWPPWPLTDGARLVLHYQLDHLARRHDITVLAAGRRPAATAPNVTFGALPAGVELEWFGPAREGVRAYAARRWAGLRSDEPADVQRVEVPGLLGALRRHVAERRPDVLHLHGWGTAQLWRVARAAGVPALHVALDCWSAALRSHQALPWWRRLLELDEPGRVRRHEHRHYPRCGAVVVVTATEAARVARVAPGARVEVVPNGVVVPRAAGAARTAARPGGLIGMHGALCTVENARAATTLVSEILPLVRESDPEVGAVLIGRDPAPGLRRLAAQRGVEVTGEVADVHEHLSRVDVYVAPFATGAGLKNKVLEAMAAGVPVVALPAAVDGIGAGPGVRVVASVSEAADAVRALLHDPEARRREGAGGRERVERDHTWAASARAIERLWEELAAGPVGSGPAGPGPGA